MGVSNPTPVLGLITNRILFVAFVDNLFDLHRHLYILPIFEIILREQGYRDVVNFGKSTSLIFTSTIFSTSTVVFM